MNRSMTKARGMLLCPRESLSHRTTWTSVSSEVNDNSEGVPLSEAESGSQDDMEIGFFYGKAFARHCISHTASISPLSISCTKQMVDLYWMCDLMRSATHRVQVKSPLLL